VINLKIVAVVLTNALLFHLGCSKRSEHLMVNKQADSSPASHQTDHAHGKGPNGGVVFDLGGHHAEFTVDHGKHECTITILADDENAHGRYGERIRSQHQANENG
jgi:hypothetical protein